MIPPGARLAPSAILAALLLPGAAPSPADAQAEEPEPTLEAVAAAADSGRVAEARSLLERWRRGRRAEEVDSGPARLLAARLAADPDSARRLYAGLAVEGGPGVAAEARLRLAQLRLAEGRPERALEDLELLRADHPGHPLEAESWLWTGHARRLAGEADRGCEAYRAARGAADGASLRERAEAALTRCRGDAGEAPTPSASAWSVQLGAFGDAEAARSLAGQAEAVGFSARVLAPGDDGLRRVRTGRWGSRADAEAAARRLADAGFRVLVVELGSLEEEAGDTDR